MSLSMDQEQEMERIDLIWKEGMLYAKKKCRKLAMGEVDFSPELRRHDNGSSYGRRLSGTKGGGESAPRTSSARPDIKRKARQCGVQCPLSCTLEQALWYRKTAINEYEKLKPIAEQLQKDHLWNLANDRSDKATKDSRKHAKCLLREEMQ
jgi:hypothetical protein